MTDSGKSLDGQTGSAHDPVMDAQADTTLLYRIDRALNMARFYRLSIQPTLFGGSSLVRNWGRIGTEGRLKVELFDTLGQAAVALERVASRKLRRGYRHENAARSLVALSRSQQQPVLNRQTIVE
ncbi:WGR domain-containing protein [Rhizobium sp. R634]|uniref:WGR domain-containing protein n=1 Tax=Rhizobium sp. R634 TaxID=1764274 RepID=UPI001FD8A063|nr:WGR domain-containing protein [Rhizobium sp. R634]